MAVISLGSTAGLRTADGQLARALELAGARVEMFTASPQRQVRTYVLTDLLWALAARRAATEAIAAHRPRRLLYSSVTAALLWPRQPHDEQCERNQQNRNEPVPDLGASQLA